MGKSWVAWGVGALGVGIRLLLVAMGSASLLDHRVEVVSPVSSLARLAEGHWLKVYGMSPYAGSAYHGSPLLPSLIGPLIGDRQGVYIGDLLRSCSLIVVADLISALLLRSMGKVLERTHSQHFLLLGLTDSSRAKSDKKDVLGAGDISFLVYLFNPFTIAICVGCSTSSIENMLIVLCLYGAATGTVTSGFWMGHGNTLEHIAYLLANGPDSPPSKLFNLSESAATGADKMRAMRRMKSSPRRCRKHQGESGTHKYMLTVDDLKPNLGLFWYFFTEVFDFFRTFFLMVFHANKLLWFHPLQYDPIIDPFFLHSSLRRSALWSSLILRLVSAACT